MKLGRLEEKATPGAKPVSWCSVAVCAAKEEDICEVWGRALCYPHVAEFVTEHPDRSRESLQAWLSKARAA